jgi:hypothetical protein
MMACHNKALAAPQRLSPLVSLFLEKTKLLFHLSEYRPLAVLFYNYMLDAQIFLQIQLVRNTGKTLYELKKLSSASESTAYRP